MNIEIVGGKRKEEGGMEEHNLQILLYESLHVCNASSSLLSIYVTWISRHMWA